MTELVRTAHSCSQLVFHLEWCTKYRHKIFSNGKYKTSCEAALITAAERHKIDLLPRCSGILTAVSRIFDNARPHSRHCPNSPEHVSQPSLAVSQGLHLICSSEAPSRIEGKLFLGLFRRLEPGKIRQDGWRRRFAENARVCQEPTLTSQPAGSSSYGL